MTVKFGSYFETKGSFTGNSLEHLKYYVVLNTDLFYTLGFSISQFTFVITELNKRTVNNVRVFYFSTEHHISLL